MYRQQQISTTDRDTAHAERDAAERGMQVLIETVGRHADQELMAQKAVEEAKFHKVLQILLGLLAKFTPKAKI
jgi:hypothetical protein